MNWTLTRFAPAHLALRDRLRRFHLFRSQRNLGAKGFDPGKAGTVERGMTNLAGVEQTASFLLKRYAFSYVEFAVRIIRE
jgi:hypothetical protein